MTLIVEIELCDTGPLVSEFPQYGGPVILIGCVARVNEDKPPVLLLLVLLRKQPHKIITTIDCRLYPPEYLFSPTGLLSHLYLHHKDELIRTPAPGLPYPDWEYTGMFI